jgi:hypothetical protein
VTAAVALLGCSGDDGEGASEGEGDNAYQLAVEEVTDQVGATVETAQVTLNEVRDGADADAAAATLDDLSATIAEAGERLSALEAPEGADAVASDLEAAIGDLSLSMAQVATDLRGPADPHDVTISGGRLLRTSDTGIGALSRALRTLADEES